MNEAERDDLALRAKMALRASICWPHSSSVGCRSVKGKWKGMGDCDGYQVCAKPVLERVAAFPVTVAVFFMWK